MKTLTTDNIVNGMLKITGSDALKFLQGQLTCDLTELTKTRCLPGAYCTPQGRIRATFIIFSVSEDEFLMILPQHQIQYLIEVMAPYVAFFKCSLSDETKQWNVFGLTESQKGNSVDLEQFPSKSWQMSILDNVITIKLPGEESRWYCLTEQPLQDNLLSLDNSSPLAWSSADLKSGMVWINEKNREQFLPHDLSLPSLGAINFTKGCYTGQEIVARMEYRGTPKYLLATLTTQATSEEIPDKLVQLVDNSDKIKIGRLVEKIKLMDNSYLILASIKRDLLDQEKLQLSLSETAILCNIEHPH
ncbi:MAG: hypothetical protein COA74_05135 [Gammaproteobacteria bacterium]|nr:MAG: hypothetical protein COA74_05135 [Gammaproteobacteria bacterium]